MKKLTKFFSFLAAGVLAAAAAAFPAFAEDITLDIEPSESNGSWGQSVIYRTKNCGEEYADAFDPAVMTEDSVVQVTYTSLADDDKNHIELIWQTWGDHLTDPVPNNNWNKIPPAYYEKGYAEFTYSDISILYGTTDFSEVYAICVGDLGDTPITVTKLVITNVDMSKAANAAETEETEAETEETEAETEESAPETEETEAETEESAAETEESAPETEESAAETEAVTEAETEAETTAAETTVSEKAEETTVSRASSEIPASKDEGMEAGGIVLIIAIIIVAAAIGVLLFLIYRKSSSHGNWNNWK